MMYFSFARTPSTTGGGAPVTTSRSQRFNTPVGKVRLHRFLASTNVGKRSGTPSPVRQLIGTIGIFRKIGSRDSICSRTPSAKS
mmetsp:Transcript_327/g.479  ORF Transcript_327/g.479 Transcript_327/m.479 type:complete len:84 (-) Transcript_327:195-446(-)